MGRKDVTSWIGGTQLVFGAMHAMFLKRETVSWLISSPRQNSQEHVCSRIHSRRRFTKIYEGLGNRLRHLQTFVFFSVLPINKNPGLCILFFAIC